jgi:hypothetical protein
LEARREPGENIERIPSDQSLSSRYATSYVESRLDPDHTIAKLLAAEHDAAFLAACSPKPTSHGIVSASQISDRNKKAKHWLP